MSEVTHRFKVDLKRRYSSTLPSIVQYDDARLEFELLDNGVAVDLSGIVRVEFAHRRPDGVTVVGDGALVDNLVTYTYLGNEMTAVGLVETSFSLFDADGTKVSIQPFKVQMVSDLRDTVVDPANPEYGALQELILEVETLNTTSAAAVTEIQTAISTVGETIDSANVVIAAAEVATVNADLAAEIARNTSTSAVETANLAYDLAEVANARADLIIGQTGDSTTEIVDARLGADLVARPTSGTLIREIHSSQLESARQTTTLVNGVSVVSGGVDALAETEIEGRTLISLANSNLEATKQYVVADKKTKVIVDGVTQAGVAKFTKGTTTVSTANFVGKVAFSTVANPHVVKYGNNAVLFAPSVFAFEATQAGYNKTNSLNGDSFAHSTSTNGQYAEHLFSFDIIAEIERKLGVIPKSTLAEKVQWVKDNVERLDANWHGLGSSVGGSKASFSLWWASNPSWISTKTHSNGTVNKLSINATSPIELYIDTNGFVHYLAYADASDGVTASSISTDYIDLVVTLKATAQLNTRPTIIRVENFEGKVTGSVVENAHVSKYAYGTTLTPPSNTTQSGETSSTRYGELAKLDGSVAPYSQSANGVMAQYLFSFNLIEAVERNVGKIPRTSVADKVQWLKDNVAKFTANWHGFGSSVGGYKATLAVWLGSAWGGHGINSTNSVAKIAGISDTPVSISGRIDANGFVHFLAYADASDGTTASTINTDYIDLEIELKPTADFTRPKVALYEVPATDYAKILVDWNTDAVVNRYPIVEGVQHLQGVGVIAEGENLLPPFTEWSLHANAVVKGAYELELNATAGNQDTLSPFSNVLPNTTYTFSRGQGVKWQISEFDEKDAFIKTPFLGTGVPVTFTTSATTRKLNVRTKNDASGMSSFTQPMLTLGNVAKPFVPRNPSYLYADVKLGSIGTVADRLYEQDGAKFIRKAIEKDVVLGGDLGWSNAQNNAGFKRLKINTYAGSPSFIATKFDGKTLKYETTANSNTNADTIIPNGVDLNINVLNSDTGFGETYAPTTAEIKAYFYGYKMNNGTFGTNYEATGTKTWIPIGDTTNARAVTVVPTSASPTQLDGTIQPYKLSYVLATPQIVNVTDKVEGQLKVNGLTQVEALSGIVRREKVVPAVNGGNTFRYINLTALPTSKTKYSTNRVLAVYKNGMKDSTWYLASGNAGYNGFSGASIPVADFDSTAEYTVTYIALDKPLLTANPTNIKLLYANNMRSSLEDAVGKVQDNSTQLSVHEKAIIDLWVRVKALEASV